MNLVGIAGFSTWRRPLRDDDDCDVHDEIDVREESRADRKPDVCGGVTSWDGFDLGAVDETAETNHLGSASLELDGAGLIISYEEYYPYGGTAFIASGSQAEVKLKEYRYTGKERDDTSGFYYHGARYFAPWTGRWMSADPAGPVDGLNLYEYVSGNPVRNAIVAGYY